jgi:hypothetical protein
MCAVPEILGAVAFAALLACMIVGLVFESRFMAHLQSQHPGIWREMNRRGKSLVVEQGQHAYAATQIHLIWLGGYSRIADARLHSLGVRAQAIAVFALICLFGLGAYTVSAQHFPSLGCLVSWN